MQLNYKEIKEINLDNLTMSIPDNAYKELIIGEAGKEHYRLLAYISLKLNNANIIELGTHRGCSSLALSINETNNIRTYDVKDIYFIQPQPSNVTRVIGNIFDLHEEHMLLDADFIFLDTAHTGEFEHRVYNYLVDNNYKGFIIYDDIWWSDAMIQFWNIVLDNIKYDITDIGHGGGYGPRGHISGTGLVDFSNSITINRL